MKKIILAVILLLTYVNADDLTERTCLDLAETAWETFHTNDKTEGKELLDKLCKDGCGKACIRLSMTPPNKTGANLTHAEYKQGCEVKFPYGFACYFTAQKIQDKKKKLELEEKSCQLGYGFACYSLADDAAYNKDNKQASYYLKMGCDANIGDNCDQLGLALIRGTYGEKNIKKAKQVFKKSCELGDNNGCKNYKILCKNNPSICK